jgi:diketogulonate reductase-like aldo/keto reductase
LKQIFDFSLDETEMAQLDALDKGIEGKIFDMKGFGG